MNLSRKVTVSALMWLVAMTAAAAIKDLPVRTINGKIYHYYEVPPKETVYSLCYRLGITKEYLIKENPTVADGLKAGTVLFFPMESVQATGTSDNNTSKNLINHQVEKGETIFGIAKKYGVSTESLIEQNPILREGLKAGQTITISTPVKAEKSENAETEKTPRSVPVNAYVVKKKETFYSIARDNGLTVAQLEAANPGVTSLKAGQVLNIPVTGEAEGSTSDVPGVLPGELLATDSISSGSGQSEEAQRKSVTIAVMLPFMLNEDSPSKAAQRCTEFYKGFLLAVDSLRDRSTDIHIKAFDTEGSIGKVKGIIASDEFKDIDYVVAPDNAEQLSLLADWSKTDGHAKILNTFIVRSDFYLSNPNVMQGNLPSPLMTDKAIKGMTERLKYSTPVFISINNSAPDKTDFVAQLKKSLDANGISYQDIAVDGRVTPANLKTLSSDGNYTFIPLSGKQADLNKILPGIIEWRDETITPTVKVFGYPEWITYRGETLENLHKLNTTVYSRFYADEEAARTRDIENTYRRWYGKGMDAAVPRQGLLGFDTGMYLLRNIIMDEERYDGVQNGFHFISPDSAAGAYNEVLYFINFRPGGQTDKYSL